MSITIADCNTIIEYSSTLGLFSPLGIIANKIADNSVIIANSNDQQVISFYDNDLTINNALLIAQNWNGGNSFNRPYFVSVDPRTGPSRSTLGV
jgi:hypothetical protein